MALRRAGPTRSVAKVRDIVGVRLGDACDGAPTALRGTLAMAALASDGWSLTARAAFDPVTDTDLWSDFATDGRLAQASPARADAPTAGPAGAALSATTMLAPGERRAIRFALTWDLPMVEFGAGRRWWKRYTRDWGRAGTRAWDLAAHALRQAPAWRAAIEAWQAPILEDEERPAWYRAALFNELYFLVDGGTFWEAGEVGDAAAGTRRPGPVRPAGVRGLPVLRLGRRRLLRLVRLLELYPELELRGIRDLLATIPIDDPTTVTIEASGRPGLRKVGGTVPHDVGGPADDPFLRPNWYRFQDVNGWKDLGPEVRAPGLARRRGRPGAGRRRPHPRRLPDRRRPDDPAVRGRSRRRRPARARRRARPDLRHLADARAVGLRRVAMAGGGRGHGGDGRAARRWRRPRPRRAGWFERGQVAFDRRLWRGRLLRLRRRGGAELRLDHGRPAGRPVVRGCDRARRHRARGPGRSGPADDPRHATSPASRAAGWARSTGCAQTGRSTRRASSRPRCGSGRPTRWRRS